jgi:acetolactate synthase-1/2/3 large subunit
MEAEKYCDVLVRWLKEMGYTHCFFVAGGNIMHILDSVRRMMTCIPVVHEVAAGIAAETFNEASPANGPRAFAMVTAGPGVTNIVTAMAGAWLESRDLLVIGGQVKTADLATNGLRQRGIQEIDGVAIVRSICVAAERFDAPASRAHVAELVERGRSLRRGPVFLELPLDVQAAMVDAAALQREPMPPSREERLAPFADEARKHVADVAARVRASRRPILLIGGGVTRENAHAAAGALRAASVGIMTTWNGFDRVDADAPNVFGRPNQWGMRRANVLIQQSDCIVALGTRLGMQQTGFNWQAFAPNATIVQFEVDRVELEKGHPRVDLAVQGDANAALAGLLGEDLGDHTAWLDYCREVSALLPDCDPQNVTAPGFIDPYVFAKQLSVVASANDVLTPCSSGGAETTIMQAFDQKIGQQIVNDKGLASMGYGLSAAIGTSLAQPGRRTILVEGDGGFTQNLQELATVAVNALPLKMFIYSNEGYASIRMTQRNYFKGAYLGCDVNTGLGFPDWPALFAAYGIPSMTIAAEGTSTEGFRELFDAPGPAAFVVMLDPEQTYYPKISSRVKEDGGMESAPLHLMTPDLPADVAERVFRHLARDPEAVGAPR